MAHARLVPVVLLLCALIVPRPLRAQRGMLEELFEQAHRGNRDSAERIEPHPDHTYHREARDAASIGSETMVYDDDLPESEVHAAINPVDTNNIIVVPIEYNSSGNKFTCHLYYSLDFGRTWKKSPFQTVPKAAASSTDAGDPVVAFDNNGRAYVIWIDLYNIPNDGAKSFWGVIWAYSDDGGATWQRPANDAVVLAHNPDELGRTALLDKEWVAVDRSHGPHRGALYVAFCDLGDVNPAGSRIEVRTMRPGTMAFTNESVPVSDESYRRVQVTSIEVDGEGVVHVVFYGERAQGDYAIWHSASTDGGASFSPPTRVADLTLNPLLTPQRSTDLAVPGLVGSRLYPFPQIAIDRSSGALHGNLYIAWTAAGTLSDRGDGLDIYFARSTDNGDTWSEPSIVNDDPRGLLRHQHHSSISVNDKGTVVVTWYDRRDDPSQLLGAYSIAYSFDGGATFTKTLPVASEVMNFGAIGSRNAGLGIGEYTQVLTTNGYAIPVWSDGRNDNGDINAYAALIPLVQGPSGVERINMIGDALAADDARVTRDEVAIDVRLAAPADVTARVVDAAGKLVTTTTLRSAEAGAHRLQFSVTDFPAGCYFAVIEAGRASVMRSFVVVR